MRGARRAARIVVDHLAAEVAGLAGHLCNWFSPKWSIYFRAVNILTQAEKTGKEKNLGRVKGRRQGM